MPTGPACALVAIAACGLFGAIPPVPTSRQPLSELKQAAPDARLIGAWRSSAAAKETEHVHIGRADDPDAPPGLMRALGVASDHADGRLRFSLNGYFFVTTIGEHNYATLVPPEAVEQKLRGVFAPDVYSFVRYRVREDVLEVWTLDEAAVAEAIARGELHGQLKVQEGRTRRLLLDEEPERIARLLMAGGEARLFPDSGRLVYRRVP